MSIDKAFISLIDMIEKSSVSAKDLAAQLSLYGSPKTLNQPVEIFENDTLSRIANDSLILKENIMNQIARLNIKENISRNLGSILGFTVSITATYFLMKWLTYKLDPSNEEKKKSQKKGRTLKNSLGIDSKLDDYELCIAADLIDSRDLNTDWSNIGGLQSTIDDIRQQVLAPFKRRLFQSALVKPPKGLLLYGPPGCGKTMIAKAVAKETDANFINLQVTSMMDKWYGETEKRVQAIFSLAHKISPTIIFIDEIDSFLSNRSLTTNETSQTIKTQFMTFWDGLTTQTDNRVMIVGATNRIDQIDPAILRRMPAQYYIGFPDTEARMNILNILLKEEALSKDVDMNTLALATEDFSGSDLEELCRKTAIIRLRKCIMAKANRVHSKEEEKEITKFKSTDFTEALFKMY